MKTSDRVGPKEGYIAFGKIEDHWENEVKVRVIWKILQERGDVELAGVLEKILSDGDCDYCSLDGDEASDLFHDLLMQHMERVKCPVCDNGLLWDGTCVAMFTADAHKDKISQESQ